MLLPDLQAVTTRPMVLVVDDNDVVRTSLGMILERGGFCVVCAASVNDALQLIATQVFDVLLSDLHMPEAGDGLTVVSAMRNAHPKAITIIFSGYPEMRQAAAAILLQTDEILVKPMDPGALVATIWKRLKGSPGSARAIETVATILERETEVTISDWFRRVKREPTIISVKLDHEERCAHLPHLFEDLVHRLREPLPLGTRALVSIYAADHGAARLAQGYSASMMVEESRMLQVSIFQTLHNHLHSVDFSLLLVDVMAIADEVDSQLAQAMASYVAGAKLSAAATA